MFTRFVGFCAFLVLLALCPPISALPRPTSRVFGGYSAGVGQFPYQVSLQENDGTHICGGVIISERHILTAAHCVIAGSGISSYPAHYFQVRVGSIQRHAGGQVLRLKNITVNKSYGNLINDIAILELEKPLVWNAYINYIELSDAEVPSGADVTICGWGLMYNGDPSPYRLQWNTLHAINSEECGVRTGWSFDSLICLDHEEDKGICDGDAGSPAVYGGKLVGIASFYVGGCGRANPDTYTKVSYYLDWIRQNMSA